MRASTYFNTRFYGYKKSSKNLSVVDIRVRTGSIKEGDTILFLGEKTPAYRCKVSEMQTDHKSIQEAKKGEAAGIKLPFVVRPKDKVFLWKKKIVT
ncbi:MAG: EF-Tu/IF-2/RF-3 family GTPase [Candidatus Omnitrophica bacterium]|nr:EF-Tu/IF-2/RF-3 family GTPase [Candidatus Omnitrophota bacterium]